ncbi:DUF748 domain-containing protein [Shewanella eurypsychrophilus]|uniref:DUF748 domain-containing protein n=1 Tax=Shewanella eurypsychrophilus TaxID=2593656 RepID=A0ABX8S320_9GAMM|nr:MULTISPECIES: DUF748 domain-containing protein [Shewanella]QFU23210.1 DUF748 domain-containing protein [Shewanella sp. YLB-09]QXP44802.1 DUF748 domain-containing protein [Shewanella eurypsychrophilus]
MSVISKKMSILSNKYRQLPKYQRYLCILLIIYSTFTALLGLLTPYIITKQVPKQLSSLLNRPVELKQVSINPFTFDVSIVGFSIREPDSSEFAGFDEFSFELRFWHSLVNGAISLCDLKLHQPHLLVQRLDNETEPFNFSDILIQLASTDKNAPSNNPEPTKIPHLILDNLKIINADLIYQDQITNSYLHYPSIDLEVVGFDTLNMIEADQNIEKNHFAIKFIGEQGGEISTQGHLQVEPLSIVGELSLTKIQLPQFWSFISEDFQAQLQNGHMGFHTEFKLLPSKDTPNDSLQFITENGQFTLEDIVFSHEESQILSLPLLTIDGISLDVQNRQIEANKLYSENFNLEATIAANGVDILPLFMPASFNQDPSNQVDSSLDNLENDPLINNDLARANANANGEEIDPVWSASLNAIELKTYDIKLTERLMTDSTLWRIAPLNLTTAAIHSNLTTPIEYQLDFDINQLGRFNSTGSVDLQSQQLDANIKLSDFALAQLQDYISPYLNITLKQGKFNTEADITATLTEELTFSGNLEIDDLLVKDNLHKKTLLKWDTMQINNIDFDKAKNTLGIENINFLQPYSRIIIAEDRSTNFEELLVTTAIDDKGTTNVENKDFVPAKYSETIQVKEVQKPVTALAIEVGSISFIDGSTFFADNSLKPNFAASIEQLEGKISQLSSTAKEAAKVDISGKIDRYAPVSLKGEINPLLDNPYLDLQLDFNSVELTSINPYSGTYAGYYIDKGQISLELNYLLDDNKLIGNNHLVVNQLKLGEPSDSSLATTMPVTLAIALLQDRHGVIDLGLQVSGDLDSPEFSFGSIIMTAFGNLITKAVTAPFTLLAGMFGEDEELDKISFESGLAKLSDAEKRKLATLAKGMIERPGLTLSVKGSVSAISDSRVLKELLLEQEIALVSQTEPADMPEALSASTFPNQGPLSIALMTTYETLYNSKASELKNEIALKSEGQALTEEQLIKEWHIALYNFSLKKEVLDDTALGTLASERARVIKAHLVEVNKIPPERVFLLDSRVDINKKAQEAVLTLGAG